MSEITQLETEILTLEELHAYLKIPKPTLYSMAQAGRLPGAKVGKHWRFRLTDIHEWLKAQQWNRPQRRRSRKPVSADAS